MVRRNPIRLNYIGLTALSAYAAFISWRLFFYAYSDNYRVQMGNIRYNLTLFNTIKNYMRHSDHISFEVLIYNLAGNVVAFMPLGFLLPLAFKGLGAVKTFIGSLIFILGAEALQLISRRGVFDVDDLLLNMLGSIIGYCIYKLLFILFIGRR